MKSVLFEINLKGMNQFFDLSTPEYSSFAEEQEVLLQEGIKYQIMRIEKVMVLVSEKAHEDDTPVKTELTIIQLENVGDKYKRMNCIKRYLNYLI